MAKSKKVTAVQVQTVTAESWRKWFEDGHAPLWIAALLTMDILPSKQVSAALDHVSHPWHEVYHRRKLTLERNYGQHPLLQAIPDHVHEVRGPFGRIVNLAAVCAFALEKDWEGVGQMIIALAPELLDQIVAADTLVSSPKTDLASTETTHSVGAEVGKSTKPNKADPHLLLTLGGMTILLERVLRKRYQVASTFLQGEKINMSAVAKEIDALLKASGQNHSAVGRRISAGLDMIDRDQLEVLRSSP